MEHIQVPAGLKNVAVTSTGISDVLAEAGIYHYRGYDAIAVAARGRIEDVWHLMHEGDLPTDAERSSFSDRIRDARRVPPGLEPMLPAIARLGPPGSLAALRSALSVAGQAIGCRSWLDQPYEASRRQAFALTALVPVLAAGLYRLCEGERPIAPRDDLGCAANLLFMLDGELPDERRVRVLETYLMLTVEHGFNNSAFAARVITSSGADVGAAVSGAMGALSGPLHGGAPARVFDMLDAVGEPSQAEEWTRSAVRRGEKLMGFGHAVYRAPDPRNRMLHALALELGGPRVAFAEDVERAAERVLSEEKPGHELHANVEFYAGVVLEQAGIPREMFSSAFACSRSIGWSAHILEQIASNKIMRPAGRYDGPAPRSLPGWWRASLGAGSLAS